MKIIETRVTATTIHMWLANDPELQNATEWMEIELPLHSLVPNQGEKSLDEFRRAILITIRNVVESELDRLVSPTRANLPSGSSTAKRGDARRI